jgi:hypothetical protein
MSILTGSLKSKTMKFGAVLVAVGALIETNPSIKALIPDSWYGWIVSGIGVLVWIFRALTTDALADKAQQP